MHKVFEEIKQLARYNLIKLRKNKNEGIHFNITYPTVRLCIFFDFMWKMLRKIGFVFLEVKIKCTRKYIII